MVAGCAQKRWFGNGQLGQFENPRVDYYYNNTYIIVLVIIGHRIIIIYYGTIAVDK